jgi:uncharacterized protein (TIGR02147 family)
MHQKGIQCNPVDSHKHSFPDYRLLLVHEYERRTARNPAYSLNAFAGSLGASTPFVCQILNGKRNLSKAKAIAILARLAWPHQKKVLFLKLIEASGKIPLGKHSDLIQEIGHLLETQEVESMDELAFHATSQWYDYAILALVTCENFVADTAWIAKRLALDSFLVESSIHRLTKVGFLSKDVSKNGYVSYARQKEKQAYWPQNASAAVRSFHKQHFEQAAKSLDSVTLERREFLGITFSISEENLPRLKEMMRSFVLSLHSVAEDARHSEVYHLGMQLYPLTTTG